jgi:gas vesicle protein
MEGYDRFESENGSGGTFVMGLLAGTVLGASLGMLFAPKSGSELRSQIANRAGDIKNSASEGYKKASDAATEGYKRASDAVADTYNRAADMASDTYKRATGAARDTYKAASDAAQEGYKSASDTAGDMAGRARS